MTTPPVTAPLDPSAQSAQPGLSQAGRLIDTFIAPRKTFEDLKRSSSWWLPWLLSAVVSLAFGTIAIQKLDLVEFTRQQMERSKMAQSRMEQLSPEQREQVIQRQAIFTKGTFFAVPVFSLIGALIFAGILMAVFNFGFAAEVPFQRALAIVMYSFLPKVVYAILMGVSLLVASDPNSIDIAGNPMPTSPGFFLDPQGNKFLYSLMTNLDIFAIWPAVLLGLGFAAVSANRKLRPSTAITTVLALYGIAILIGAAFKAAF